MAISISIIFDGCLHGKRQNPSANFEKIANEKTPQFYWVEVAQRQKVNA